MQYRRITAPGGTFFTHVTSEHRKIFADEQAVALLRQVFRTILLRHPFKIEAAIVLPDHLHILWRLLQGDSDYSTRRRLIKSYFTHHWSGANDRWVSRRSVNAEKPNLHARK
jgi:putative transposase